MFVRLMTVYDVDRVYDIVCRSFDEYYEKEVLLFLIGRWPSGQLVAVDATGYLAGFLSGSRLTRDKAGISLFAVDETYRGRGIGSRLLDEFRLRTLMDGKQYIQLEVRDTNTDGISFYRNRGFAATEYAKGFYNNGGNAVKMVCSVQRNS